LKQQAVQQISSNLLSGFASGEGHLSNLTNWGNTIHLWWFWHSIWWAFHSCLTRERERVRKDSEAKARHTLCSLCRKL
jgi:hypothetical protein